MSGKAVDLTNCDREPIHIPGSIQPHGCLLVCDVYAGQVLRHSANTPVMLEHGGEINGVRLESIVGDEIAHALRNALAAQQEGERPALLLGQTLPAGIFDIAIHRFRSNVIIEFEAAIDGQALQTTRAMIGRVTTIDDIDQLTRQTARLIRGMLGYDRVMMYRFEQDGSGKVIAEAKRGDLESFLGQYFPASDIPRQARELYLRNTIRVIGDANCQIVPIVPVVDAAGEALDLSLAHLRSVSPIHLEYLRNMGVAASMSISIIINGELWGLIACHHYSARVLAMSQRVAAEMFGGFFSLHLQALSEKRKLTVASKARAALDRFLRIATHHADMGQLMKETLADFMPLIACDGIGLWMNGQYTSLGFAPPQAAIPGIVRLAAGGDSSAVWANHALGSLLPGAEDFSATTSGVLAVPLSQLHKDYLFFFRKELVQTLNWAGNPEKTYESGPLGDRLTPRKSFAIWKETVRLQAQPWSEADRDFAEVVRAVLVEIGLRHSELMAEERSRADVRQRMLNEELNHRVKNILSLIKSLVAQPVHQGRSLVDYIASLKGRIQALSFAHDQVVRGDGGGTLWDLLTAELAPYRHAAVDIVFGGSAVMLDARAFSVMALVLHELTTNAAKYGALSKPGGRLAVSWHLTEVGDCSILWQESGGPQVRPPSRSGFGTALIDRSIPYDLGGKSDVVYAPEGLRAVLVVPGRHASLPATKDDAKGRAGDDIGTDTSDRLDPSLKILLVEDQMLIAMDVENMLADAGVETVVTAASSAEAFVKLKMFSPDVAVLDVNLGSETSLGVAAELARRGAPFIFATGYGQSSMIPPEFSGAVIIGKPYDIVSLTGAIRKVLVG